MEDQDHPDKAAGTLTIRDNGIGMTREEVIAELGPLPILAPRTFYGHCRTSSEDRPELIGSRRGIYSSFMVADKVVVITRKATEKTTKAVRWNPLPTVRIPSMKLKKKGRIRGHPASQTEEKKYLDEWELRSIIRNTPTISNIRS